MKIKVALLLVSALIAVAAAYPYKDAVAAAYPYKDQQQAIIAGCNYNAVYEIFIFGQQLNLVVCTISKHMAPC